MREPKFIAERVGFATWWGSTADKLYPFSTTKRVAFTRRGAIRLARRVWRKSQPPSTPRLEGHHHRVSKFYDPESGLTYR